MSTALAVVDVQKTYLALQDGGGVAEAMKANLGEGAGLREGDLTRVPIPTGGGVTWLVPGLAGDEAAKSLEGVLVHQCVRGVVWPSSSPQEGQLPALVSHDLETARLVSDDLSEEFLASIDRALQGDGTYDWELLPQTQWGSGKDGNGKAAKEQRVLYLLRKDEPLPIIVVIQPGSLKNWREFIVSITKAGIPFYRAVVSLSLEKAAGAGGEPYAKVIPKLIGVLSKEQGDVILEKFTKPMREIAASSFAS